MKMYRGISIRPIRPEDVPALKVLLCELSVETRYRRFHHVVNDFSPAQWRYLTSVDGHDHVALVACRGERILGVARFIRDREQRDTAEVAFVVHDAFQRCGLGRRLCEQLVRAARRERVARFRALVVSHNLAIRKLLSTCGLEVVFEDNGAGTTNRDCDSAAE